MNKEELAGAAAKTLGCSRADARRVVDAVLDGIASGLAKDKQVRLVGFGTLRARTMAAREGRNPRTGEVVQVPERDQVFFTAGKGLKDALTAGRRRRKK